MKKKKKNLEFFQAGLLDRIPEAPGWLSGTGRSYFAEIAAILFNGGILLGSDLPVIAILSAELSRYRTAYEAMETEGAVVRLPNGYNKASQYNLIAKEAFRNASDLAAQFGLTLHGREKIGMDFDPVLQFDKHYAQYQLQNWLGHLETDDLLSLQDELEKFIDKRIQEEENADQN